jgi:hypothetical protein
MTTKKHEHILLQDNTMNFPKDFCMSQGDLIILHNLCVDVLDQHPELIGIERIMNNLAKVIELPVIPDDWTPDFEMDEDR